MRPQDFKYIDEIDHNYRNVRERIIELVKAGYEVERWELRAPKDGFRVMTVFFRGGGTTEWNQPWVGDEY